MSEKFSPCQTVATVRNWWEDVRDDFRHPNREPVRKPAERREIDNPIPVVTFTTALGDPFSSQLVVRKLKPDEVTEALTDTTLPELARVHIERTIYGDKTGLVGYIPHRDDAVKVISEIGMYERENLSRHIPSQVIDRFNNPGHPTDGYFLHHLDDATHEVVEAFREERESSIDYPVVRGTKDYIYNIAGRLADQYFFEVIPNPNNPRFLTVRLHHPTKEDVMKYSFLPYTATVDVFRNAHKPVPERLKPGWELMSNILRVGLMPALKRQGIELVGNPVGYEPKQKIFS